LSDLRSVPFQTRAPSSDADPGACEIAYYTVDAGVLTMRTAEGSKTGKTYRLQPGDDERLIACRLGLQAWRNRAGQSDFNRPLHYASWGGY
jgi:hypothetical protein